MSGKTFTVRRGMTAIPNQTIYGTFAALEDKDGDPSRLSIQSLGLLLLLLSRPSGKASMGYRAFQGRGMGRDALLRAFRELGDAGLRYQFKRRSPGGSIITDTVISETPLTPEEAEAEWIAYVAKDLGGKPVDNYESDRAPENGATSEKEASTVRRFTGARSTGASLSRESDNQSTKASPLVDMGETNAGAGEAEAEPADPAADSPNRRAVREALERSKQERAAAALAEAKAAAND